ncbi:MAG: hypothetical protein J6S75_10670 [Thermoguttaceae bacterium]|nr:hypothetical protein [Thermoguttaceae bacterium]
MKQSKKNTFASGLRYMIMEKARYDYPDLDTLSETERREETGKLLGEIQSLKADGKRSGRIDTESLNHYKTLVAALNFGLIDHTMSQTGCHRRSKRTKGIYEWEDYQERAANILMDCAEHYNTLKGAFSTYVIESVKRKIFEIDYRNQSEFGTEQSGKDMRDIRRACDELEAAGEGTSPEAIFERVHRNNPKSTLTEKKIREVFRYMTRVEDCVGGKDGDRNRIGTILERQRDSTPESWEAASVSELERDLCAELSQHFSQNNADIVFDRLQGLSEKKTAEKHGVKKEEVQAIYAHAKKVLRKSPLLQRYLSA